MEFFDGENDKLMEFSLNYELQEDPRFDEVGTTGVIAWFLKKLEPQSVLETPLYLRVAGRATFALRRGRIPAKVGCRSQREEALCITA